jgi:aldose 1-epimerase
MTDAPAALHPALPSGQQITLHSGDQEVTVVEVGASLRSYRVGGEDVLDGFAEDEMSTAGRGQVLAPWPNRLAGGHYEFDGQSLQTPLSEPEKGNAIHGFVRTVNWVVRDQTVDQAVLSYRLHPQPGYPFLLDLALTYTLGESGLSVELTATNRGSQRAPFGYGAHPYVRIGDGVIDGLELSAPGTQWLRTDEHAIPVGREPVAGTDYDFLNPRPIGDTKLDTGYVALRRDDDGLARIVLAGTGRRVTVWLDRSCDYLMLFTGDTLPEGRRRHGLGVEPMTCAPNAFVSGDGLRALEPGETTGARWGIRAEGFGR